MKYAVSFASLLVVLALCGFVFLKTTSTTDASEIDPAAAVAVQQAVPAAAAPAAVIAASEAAPDDAAPPAVETTAPEAAPAAAPEPAKGPKIASPEPIYDYGTAKSTQDIDHTFIIKNEGDATLILTKLQRTCGCTNVEAEKMEVEPGEEIKVKATLKLAGRQGRNAKYVNIFCNDPDPDIQQRGFRIGFDGNVIAPVMYEPPIINYSQILEDEVEDRHISVYAGFPDSKLEILEVDTSEAPNIETKIETVEEGRKYDLVISVKEPFPVGSIRQFIHVKTNLDELRPQRIGLFGQMIHELAISPPEISLSYYDDDPEYYDSDYHLSVAGGRVKEFEITSAESEVEGMTAEVVKLRDSFYRVTLRNVLCRDAINGKSLLLHTSIPGAEIVKIPFEAKRYGPHRPKRNPS